jgi:hypothetical protein
VIKRKPVVDLAMPVLPDRTRCCGSTTDREENHDPGGRCKTAVLTQAPRLENRLPFASEALLSEVADLYPAC